MAKVFTAADRSKAQAAKARLKSSDELLKMADLPYPAAQIASIRKRLDSMPVTCRMGYVKAMSGKSPAAGIRAHCLECVGWQRREVARCTAVACPLWPYRPYK